MKVVAAAIIIRNGRVLICRRAPGEKLAGFWEFPGGKVEPGESLQECLERELREELDVEVRAGEIIRLTVHDDYAWVASDVLPDLRLAPADVLLYEHI
ncbi:MAG TPA: 8-oxo-dGTP diphosphatase MutT [Spirochaeta sp.]|nr:8-oxo-dGTP diphosphatase MutT [Spirochaeta sp.]